MTVNITCKLTDSFTQEKMYKLKLYTIHSLICVKKKGNKKQHKAPKQSTFPKKLAAKADRSFATFRVFRTKQSKYLAKCNGSSSDLVRCDV